MKSRSGERLSSVKKNSGIVPQIKPQVLPSTSTPVHHLLIILSFGTMQSELLKASLNKSQINLRK
jgi:hypothetical protein